MANADTVKNRKLKLIPTQDMGLAPHSRLMIHGIRLILLYLVLFATVTFQLFQKQFINVTVWLPVLNTLFVVFLINSIYFSFTDYWSRKKFVDLFLFATDFVVFSLLIFYTGAEGSLFFLLFLIHLVLIGFLFSRWTVLSFAFLASALYSMVLSLEAGFVGQPFYTTLLFNNAALIAVAALSSVLSDQFQFFGQTIEKSERQVEALKDFNELILDNISSGLMTINLDQVIVSRNPAAESILNRKDILGLNLRGFLPDLSRDIQSGKIASTKGATHRFEMPFERDEGEKITLEVIVSPLLDLENHPQGFLVLFQDLTEIKALEKQMRQQDKLAAVGQLAAGIAHEIRNPLASISGSIQLLVASPENLKDEDLKLMRIVLREIDRLNGLITEFLEFVRPDVQANEVVQVPTILQEVLEMVRFNKGLPQDVQQKVSFTSKLPILGHRDKLKQAFLNIVINSYQAMAETPVKLLTVQVFEEGDHLKVMIQDTGCGMKEKILDRMFEPFLTTKPKGTGLGLAITHKILESHGAQIFVTSEEGKGTQFTMLFPFGVSPEPKEEVNESPAFGTA